MKNLNNSTENELNTLLQLAIGRAFRCASLGDEKGAMTAKEQAKLINQELKVR